MLPAEDDPPTRGTGPARPLDVASLRRAAVAPVAGPPPSGRRRAGWVPERDAAVTAARVDDDEPLDDEPLGDVEPLGDDEPVVHVAGSAPAGREPGLAELRARVADRVPPAWREARWALPVPAAVVLVLLSVVVGGGALLLSWRTAPAPAPRVVPARVQPTATDPAPVPGAVSPRPAGSPGPVVAPTVAQAPAARVVVHVVGQVGAPGVVDLPAGSRVADAVEAAGGLGALADVTRVNLARPLVDGEQVLVPRPGEELPAAAPGGGAQPGADPAGGGAADGDVAPPAADGPLNLNAASAADLEALPGIGPVLSARILEWREQHGRFSSIEELREVSGIGEKVLERLRPLVGV